MPSLDWSSKSKHPRPEGKLELDSIIYPPPGFKEDSNPPNRLILGDNLRVMNALLPAYENSIDLIYADPPFFTNKGYPALVVRRDDSRIPEE